MPTANALSPYAHAGPSLPIYVNRRLTHDHEYYYYSDDDEAPTTEPTAVPTTEPTLAPTNVGELSICNFTAGFCDWTQGIDDNFDWTLTSEATPTSNTGPGTGSGHGGGAFIHIEANDQAEGNVAVVTSSGAGCGLLVDYHMYGGGIGTLTQLALRMLLTVVMQLGCQCGRRMEIKETAGRLRLFPQHRTATTGSLPHAVEGFVAILLLIIST
jgi:hypothetical protein